MSRTAWVPNYGAEGGLYQPVQVAEPGEPGYPTPALPEGDPWAPAVNRVIAEVEAGRPDAYLEPEADAGPDANWEEARAAFHRLAAEDAKIWAEPEPEPEAEL